MLSRRCSSTSKDIITDVMPLLRYLERKMAGRKINTAKKSSLVDLLEAGLVIEEQVL